MNLSKLKEPFPADQIEWRLGQAGKRGSDHWAMCLAYVQARAIMDRLDDVCGPENWKVEYRVVPSSEGIQGGIIAQISIKCLGEWVTKEDGAEQTDIETFKGGLSSALKRAGSVWGIGRYLYDLESGWANIVPKGTKDAKHGQTKDKESFYWLPPTLPSWALPTTSPPAKKPDYKPMIEADPGDGIIDITTYTIPFGKWRNRSIEQVYRDHGRDGIHNYLAYLESKAQEENKPIQGVVKEFISNCEAYIAAMENAPIDAPPVDHNYRPPFESILEPK